MALRDNIIPLVKAVQTAEKLGKDRKNPHFLNCLVIYEALQGFNWIFYTPS